MIREKEVRRSDEEFVEKTSNWQHADLLLSELHDGLHKLRKATLKIKNEFCRRVHEDSCF
jgi:hypothetical protein